MYHIPIPDTVSTALAEFKTISKYFEQPGTAIRNHVLDSINFQICGNDSIAIVGPSGSGKSTLLNIIGTLEKASSGIVFLNGTATDTLNEKELASLRNRFIGHVFQQHYLIPQLNLLENVLLPTLPGKNRSNHKETIDRALYLIERVGLKEHSQKRPYQLSVGECQRTAVVRALINKPRLLLADEPTGSLDAENAGIVGKLLVELSREHQMALLIVTHSLELAKQTNQFYRLSSGKLSLMQTL